MCQENPSQKSSFGATIRFVKEKRLKEKYVNASERWSDDESGVELEGTSNQTKKRSSWRFAAMFTKSPSASRQDKGKLNFFRLFTESSAIEGEKSKEHCKMR